MKDLVRANHQCKDEGVGSWLCHYIKGELDENRHALFVEHLAECLRCMALYNIDTKHEYGYINLHQTCARQIKAKLLKWLPPRKHLFAALLLWVMVVSFPTIQTAYLTSQEAGDGFEKQSPELSVLQFSAPQSFENEDAANSINPFKPAQNQPERVGNLSSPVIQTRRSRRLGKIGWSGQHAHRLSNSDVEPPNLRQQTPTPNLSSVVNEGLRIEISEVAPYHEKQYPEDTRGLVPVLRSDPIVYEGSVQTAEAVRRPVPVLR